MPVELQLSQCRVPQSGTVILNVFFAYFGFVQQYFQPGFLYLGGGLRYIYLPRETETKIPFHRFNMQLDNQLHAVELIRGKRRVPSH